MEALLCSSCGAANSEFDSRCVACGAALPASSVATVVGLPGSVTEPLPEPPARQISHYRLLRPLGRGGMGVVHLAEDVELGRQVAIKFLHERREARPADAARFRREARAAASLDHPNIGTVYEVGEHEGVRFLVMAYYDGTTLAQLLARAPERRLPIADAAAITGQLAAALAAAHGAGIVHRDLKPENVMVLPDGRVKLLDFGLARWVDTSGITEEGIAIGTAAYMAPEQLRGARTGPAADLWALGVVVYEMVAGRRPFGGEQQGMVHAILREEPAPLREARPDAPVALERIVSHCLVKEPADRWPAATDVLAELQAAGLWGGSGSGGTLGVPRRRTHRRVWVAAAGVVLLAALALAAFLLTRKPASSVYVAVLPPEIAGSLPAEDQARVAANLQASLLRTVAALDGLAALGPSQVNRVKGSPMAVARAVAAGEVVASRADCAGDFCQVTLQRLAGRDGRVLGSEALTIPSSQPKLFADSAAAALRHVYADRRLRVARLGLEIDEEDYRAFFDLRQRVARGEVSDAVLTRLDELRGRAPSFLEAYTLEAKVARRLHHDTGERRYLDRGLAVAREALPRAEAAGDPAPFQALIDLYRDAGRLDDAEAVLARLYEIDPAGSLLQRGQLAKQRGHPEEALELLHAAVRLHPSRATLITVANVEYELSRFDEARRHAEAALARSPGDFESLGVLAQIELLRGNPERAVALLREAVKSDPGSGSLNNLGTSLMLLRRYGEAEETLRKALSLQPDAPDPILNLADCLTLLGRTAEARTLYARLAEATARRATPGWDVLGVRAQALAHLGKTDEALDAIQQALRLSPENGQLDLEAAVVYAVIGDRGSALFYARKAAELRVDPNWFALPFFDPLRGDPAFRRLTRPAAPPA
jgi:tetratricopeptide (TPR) repeat protein